MLTKRIIQTNRLKQHVVQVNEQAKETVLFIHGNVSSSVFWEEQMQLLPNTYRAVAADLRGYGKTEPLQVDSAQGGKQWADDLVELLDALGIADFHLVAHSLGASVAYNLLLQVQERVKSVALIAPVSPFGFGGTKDEKGTPCFEDFAGTGGGTVNPDFAKLLGQGDTTEDNPMASPRVVMNAFYWKPPFKAPNEDELLQSMITTRVGETAYPGDFETSANWPFVKPGNFGPINAASPKNMLPMAKRLLNIKSKLPFLWVRGSDDQIVGNQSMFDMGSLGKLGLVPDYPGEDVFPPQPMLDQTRFMLETLKANGATYNEVVIADTGHTPYIEKPREFASVLANHLTKAS